MGQTFEHLIERIQTEAIDKADTEAERLIAQATRKAADIVRNAEVKAAKLLADSKEQSATYTEQSTRSLEQAARNLLMSIGDGVQQILNDLVTGAVDEAMDIKVLRELITKAVDAYIAREGQESQIRVLLAQEDREQLVRYFQERYKDIVHHDIELEVDSQVYKGFRVSYGEEHVYHDFTRESIAQALVNYLRPHLSEVVERAARQQQTTEQESAS